MPRERRLCEYTGSGDKIPKSHRGLPSGHSADAEGRRRALDFADAEEVVERSLGHERTNAWTPIGFARRRDLETGILSVWADENDLWIPETLLTGIERGRMEHDLIYVGNPPHRVLKLTRGPNFVMLDGQFRIVISQRFIEPVPASARAISAFFTGAGFEQLFAEAWYRAADNVAVFDASSTNLLEFLGHLFTIDILPVRPNEIMLERIHKDLSIPFSSR